jgi:hypothetical protein
MQSEQTALDGTIRHSYAATLKNRETQECGPRAPSRMYIILECCPTGMGL